MSTPKTKLVQPDPCNACGKTEWRLLEEFSYPSSTVVHAMYECPCAQRRLQTMSWGGGQAQQQLKFEV